MGKTPNVERCPMDGKGITYESASRWLMFLAEEASFADEHDKADAYRQRAFAYMRHPQGVLHDENLEKEIEKWNKKTKKNAQA